MAAPSRFDKTNKVLEKALKSSIRSRPAGEVFVKSLSALPLDASEAQRLCMDSMQSVHRNIEKEFALYCSETKLKEKLDQLDARFEEQPVISSSGERWCVQVYALRMDRACAWLLGGAHSVPRRFARW